MKTDDSITSISPFQVLSAVTVAVTLVLHGMMTGWSAVLPKLQEDSTSFTVTDEDVSWLVSLTSVVGMVTSLVSGPLIEWTGPRRLILLSLLPVAGCWLLMAFTPYISLLYVGRAGTAICCFFVCTIVQPLVAELSPASIRGLVCTASEVAGAVGLLLSYVLAQVASWVTATAACAAPLPLLIILVLFVPESPYWLVRRGRPQDAATSLRRLLRHKGSVADQLAAIMSTSCCTQASALDQFMQLRKPQNARPVLLLLSVFVLRELGGRSVIFNYSVYIFRQAGVELDAFTCTVLVGVVRLLCTCVSAATLDCTGRRALLLVTAVVCAVTQGVTGVFLYLQLAGASWVPLVSLLVFVGSYGIGLGPIPWVHLGELLPSPVRSLGVSIITSCYTICLFVVNYAFLKLISYLGLGITFITLASSNFLLVAIVWRWLPETKNISLQELEDVFSSGGKMYQEQKPQHVKHSVTPSSEDHKYKHSSNLNSHLRQLPGVAAGVESPPGVAAGV